MANSLANKLLVLLPHRTVVHLLMLLLVSEAILNLLSRSIGLLESAVSRLIHEEKVRASAIGIIAMHIFVGHLLEVCLLLLALWETSEDWCIRRVLCI